MFCVPPRCACCGLASFVCWNETRCVYSDIAPGLIGRCFPVASVIVVL